MEKIPSNKNLATHSQFARILHNSSQQHLLTSPLKQQSPKNSGNGGGAGGQMSHRSYLRIKSRLEQMAIPESDIRGKIKLIERDRSMPKFMFQ
jgi:hypothetical protein